MQHEQIHFALTEIAARELTGDSQKWAADVLVIQPTPQEVRAKLARQIKNRINAAMEANLKRQAEFDNDTSLFSILGVSSGGHGRWRMNSNGLVFDRFQRVMI